LEECFNGHMTNATTSFVDTPLLGEARGASLRKSLSAAGLDFALPEDCAKAAMRIATDTSINGKQPFPMDLEYSYIHLPGRALAIVPRQMVPTGYVDIQHDEPKEGSILHIFEAASDRQRQARAAQAQAQH